MCRSGSKKSSKSVLSFGHERARPVAGQEPRIRDLTVTVRIILAACVPFSCSSRVTDGKIVLTEKADSRTLNADGKIMDRSIENY